MKNDQVIIKAKGQTWTLRMVPSAWIELEDAGLGNIQEIGSLLQTAMSFRTLRSILAAGLRHHHPDIPDDTIAEIADDIGSEELLMSVAKVIQVSMPKAPKGAGGNAPQPPVTTTATVDGTGISS